MRLGPKMRRRAYYTVEKAGAMEPLDGPDGKLSGRRPRRYSRRTRRAVLACSARVVGREAQKLRQKMREAGLKRRRRTGAEVAGARETKVEAAADA